MQPNCSGLLLLFILGGVLVQGYELHWGDAAGDEYLLDPSSQSNSTSCTGLFDILEFSVSDELGGDGAVRFQFTLANMDDPWDGPLGFSAALVQCYIHTSPLGSWRVQQHGSSHSVGNPAVTLSPLYRWVAMVTAASNASTLRRLTPGSWK
jgi:hypothetical protein